jgi:hypothetical protein
MPTTESTDLARRLKLVLTIDDKRASDDPLKLFPALRKDVMDDAENLDDADGITGSSEGERTEASGKKRKAYNELERQLRGGHRYIMALDDDTITEEERAGVLEAYLWKSGLIGRFDDTRCVALAKQAAKVSADGLVKELWRYPAVRLARIAAQLAIIEDKTDAASSGDRQSANKERDAALDLAASTLLRVRFWYCCATRDADKTPELAKIDYQPRREHGTVPHGGTSEPATPSAPPA